MFMHTEFENLIFDTKDSTTYLVIQTSYKLVIPLIEKQIPYAERLCKFDLYASNSILNILKVLVTSILVYYLWVSEHIKHDFWTSLTDPHKKLLHFMNPLYVHKQIINRKRTTGHNWYNEVFFFYCFPDCHCYSLRLLAGILLRFGLPGSLLRCQFPQFRLFCICLALTGQIHAFACSGHISVAWLPGGRLLVSGQLVWLSPGNSLVFE